MARADHRRKTQTPAAASAPSRAAAVSWSGGFACALLIALAGCQTPVEQCNSNPDDPECIPDAGTVGGLTYRTRQLEQGDGWTDVQLKLCGEFIREIVWLMPQGIPADGFVIQQVDVTTTGTCPVPPASPYLDTCTDPPTVEHLPPGCVDAAGEPFIDRGSLRFWEAFPMVAGEVRYARTDTWNQFPQAVAEGEMTIAGAARYYTAEEMGAEHPDDPMSPFNQAPYAIPNSRVVATDRAPYFWLDDDRPTLDRRMRVSWLCCPPLFTQVEEDTHDR